MKRLTKVPLILAAALAAVAAPATLAAQEAEAPDDPYIWLEEVEGERALAWVTAQSAETLEELRQHPTFDPVFEETLEILNSDDRIAFPSIRGDFLYNFWQDRDHARGIYRRTSWESYLGGDPTWETVLDIDALAEAEGVPWAFRGMQCLGPENVRCLVNLSRGGADATEIREFDLSNLEFVEDGFFLPEAKNGMAWVDEDAVLVATDFGEGTMTTSGYPRTARLWERGESLDEAEVVFEADAEDMAVFVGSTEIEEDHHGIVVHLTTIFESVQHLLMDGELVAMDVPADAQTFIYDDQIVVRTVSPWTVGGETYAPATVVAMDVRDFLAGERGFTVVAESTDRRIVQGASPTEDYLLVNVLDNVQGELWRYRMEEGEWRGEKLPAPAMSAVNVVATEKDSNRFFFTASSFTRPTTLFLAEEDGDIREVRRSPDWFDAEGMQVAQHWATSKDGTEVPYFIVHPAGMDMDGGNPTLLTAYGGFQISRTPFYSGTVGRAWLERGGVYVLANIRGGGEFGPQWWRAALKENRQRAYDDFLAVAEDLIERGVTSPDHLGIQGGSNGGLLVGVAMTQRPDLFDAVVSAVPLLDMRRYNRLLAGASWMAEYGNPDKPEEWAYIKEYSPYQNLDEDAEYPRALFYTTTRDDRVHPGHARKMAHKMMDMGHDVLYWENTEGGHGSGVTPEQRARQTAITYAYLWKRLGEEGRPATF